MIGRCGFIRMTVPILIGSDMKKKIRVFLSFEFSRDNELHRSFYGQAEHHSQYEIIDCSLNEPYYPGSRWLEKVRKQITLSDIVIVVMGADTHNASEVEKEVTVANQLKKPMFQIRPKRRTAGEIRGAGEVIPWKWKKINAKIAEKLSE